MKEINFIIIYIYNCKRIKDNFIYYILIICSLFILLKYEYAYAVNPTSKEDAGEGRSQYFKVYRKQHKERRNELKKLDYEQHPERWSGYNKKYYEKNKEKILENRKKQRKISKKIIDAQKKLHVTIDDNLQPTTSQQLSNQSLQTTSLQESLIPVFQIQKDEVAHKSDSCFKEDNIASTSSAVLSELAKDVEKEKERKEKRKAYNKAYYIKKKAKINEKCSAYYKKNKKEREVITANCNLQYYIPCQPVTIQTLQNAISSDNQLVSIVLPEGLEMESTITQSQLLLQEESPNVLVFPEILNSSLDTTLGLMTESSSNETLPESLSLPILEVAEIETILQQDEYLLQEESPNVLESAEIPSSILDTVFALMTEYSAIESQSEGFSMSPFEISEQETSVQGVSYIQQPTTTTTTTTTEDSSNNKCFSSTKVLTSIDSLQWHENKKNVEKTSIIIPEEVLATQLAFLKSLKNVFVDSIEQISEMLDLLGLEITTYKAQKNIVHTSKSFFPKISRSVPRKVENFLSMAYPREDTVHIFGSARDMANITCKNQTSHIGLITDSFVKIFGFLYNYNKQIIDNYSRFSENQFISLAKSVIETHCLSIGTSWNTQSTGFTGYIVGCCGWGNMKNIRYSNHKGEKIENKGYSENNIKGCCIRLGYNIPIEKSFIITPFIGSSYITMKWKPYAEHSGVFLCNISKYNEKQLNKNIGVHISLDITNKESLQICIIKNLCNYVVDKIDLIQKNIPSQLYKVTVERNKNRRIQKEICLLYRTCITENMNITLKTIFSFNKNNKSINNYLGAFLTHTF